MVKQRISVYSPRKVWIIKTRLLSLVLPENITVTWDSAADDLVLCPDRTSLSLKLSCTAKNSSSPEILFHLLVSPNTTVIDLPYSSSVQQQFQAELTSSGNYNVTCVAQNKLFPDLEGASPTKMLEVQGQLCSLTLISSWNELTNQQLLTSYVWTLSRLATLVIYRNFRRNVELCSGIIAFPSYFVLLWTHFWLMNSKSI